MKKGVLLGPGPDPDKGKGALNATANASKLQKLHEQIKHLGDGRAALADPKGKKQSNLTGGDKNISVKQPKPVKPIQMTQPRPIMRPTAPAPVRTPAGPSVNHRRR